MWNKISVKVAENKDTLRIPAKSVDFGYVDESPKI